MLYFIKNIDNGKWLARWGMEHSYTKNLDDAQPFRTLTQAQNAKCENEVVVSHDQIWGAYHA